VILLDTHVWIWWIEGNDSLRPSLRDRIDSEPDLAISAISLVEVATKAARGTLQLTFPLNEWMDTALNQAGIQLIPISPAVAIEAANLPGDFHKDPADRLIVATARVHGVALATQDGTILQYPHVSLLRP